MYLCNKLVLAFIYSKGLSVLNGFDNRQNRLSLFNVHMYTNSSEFDKTKYFNNIKLFTQDIWCTKLPLRAN